MKAIEELRLLQIEHCPECHCAVGDDWDYKDYSNRTIIICPQCQSELDCEEYPIVQEKESEVKMIKESEVLERIGAVIDCMDLDDLAQLHNSLTDHEPIAWNEIVECKGWHLVPMEGAH